MYRYVEGVEGEGEAAHGGVDAVSVAGGAYRGCAVGGGVGGDYFLFRFAAAKQQAMGGENQYVCGKSREPGVQYRESFHRSDMSLYSAVASKEGQALGAKSRCPYIRAPGYCALSFFRSWRRAVFCMGVRVSFGAAWPLGSLLGAHGSGPLGGGLLYLNGREVGLRAGV